MEADEVVFEYDRDRQSLSYTANGKHVLVASILTPFLHHAIKSDCSVLTL